MELYSYITLEEERNRTVIKEFAAEMEITDGMNAAERMVKRLFDIVGSLAGMVLLSPLCAVIALMIKRRGEGSVFFSQERIGYGGRPFRILKFRTMPSDYEADGVPRLSLNPADDQEPLGRFLREHHLDELPQLWNVLVGEMSFVGPRPERRYFIDQIMQRNPDYEHIYRMRPGLTSMATLYNGYTDTMEKMLVRLQMDLEYLKKRSLWLDVKIMLTTANFILNGKKI